MPLLKIPSTSAWLSAQKLPERDICHVALQIGAQQKTASFMLVLGFSAQAKEEFREDLFDGAAGAKKSAQTVVRLASR